MTLEDIKIKTNEAHEKKCVYISPKRDAYGSNSCVGDRCFYWNQDHKTELANYYFKQTVLEEISGAVSCYRLKQGVLQYVTKFRYTDEEKVKTIENHEKFFQELIARNEIAKDENIYYDKTTSRFMQKVPKDRQIGYCMKVAKELGFI